VLEILFSWSTLMWILFVIYVPICFGLIFIVLLQKGKGVGFSGAFGMGGGMDTVFGARGGQSLPVRITQGMAAAFMVISMLIVIVQGRVSESAAPELVDVSQNEGGGALDSELQQELDDLNIGEALDPETMKEAQDNEAAPPEAPGTSPAETADPDAEAPEDATLGDDDAGAEPDTEIVPIQIDGITPAQDESDADDETPEVPESLEINIPTEAPAQSDSEQTPQGQ